MKKIINDRFYSLIEVQKLCKIKSRQYLVKYINDGILRAIRIGDGKAGGCRYAIKGNWVKLFNEKYKKGVIYENKYSVKELKMLLSDVLKYCSDNKINTLKEFTQSINKLKE